MGVDAGISSSRFRESRVQVEMDNCFRSHDVGEICNELMLRMVSITDEAYPELMKALYG